MKRTYSLSLSSAEIKELQKHLKDYQKWLKKKSEELCKRLAEIGVNTAAVYFETALYDGINDSIVKCVAIENGYKVTANGNAVLFIEFGTGVHYPDDAPLGEYEGADGMVHGSYGMGFGNNDYWFYTGLPGNAGGELAYGHKNTTITHGNPANMPMYTTVKELEQEFERIAREVFGS